MKIRKVNKLSKVLAKKGFVKDPEKDHHKFYYLYVDGKKTHIHTYLSHGINEYGNELMAEIKKQLKFKSSNDCDRFFDCPMTKEKYIEHLKTNGEL